MASVMIPDLLHALQQRGLMPGMEEERRKLLQLFTAILPLLPDAELLRAYADEHNAKRVSAETWLRNLNAAVYEVDDIVDGFRYATLRAEAETDRLPRGDKVRTSIFSFCKPGRLRLTLTRQAEANHFKEGMRDRLIEIVIKIGDLVQRSSDHFISRPGQGVMPCAEGQQDPTSSSLKEIEPIIVGRDEEKEKVVHTLLDLPHTIGDTISVLSIVGWEGMGKSTLARFICGDARIKGNFEVILWVNVGDGEFNVGRIAKSVIDQVIGKDCCLSEGDADLLRRRIYQELSGKKYLLVMDDVQLKREDKKKWEQLKSWLEQSAATGSFLIITTPDLRMAVDITSFDHIFMPSRLRKDVLWTLFCRRALIADKEICPEVLQISQQILEGCGGFPLSVNLMGGLMRFKKEPAEWQEVIHQINEFGGWFGDIWPLINLCYNNLSSETKECFAFCSIFPVGHYMDKEVLVKLWMANGLISSNGPTSVEEKGNHIFNELALRHLFEDVKLVTRSSSRDKHGYHSRVVCKMNSVIHEMARSVSRKRYAVLPNSLYIQQPGESPRISSEQIYCLSICGDSLVDIPVLLKNYPHVRTLISLDVLFERTVNCSAVPELNSLRALHLHSAKFDRDLFELKYTKHLRYLDLSGSRIKRLPESASSLYFLQTLNLSKCLLLCRLPEDIRYMRRLSHLYVDECPRLKKMPIHLGQLSCLKTLTTYIVGDSVGNNIDELKCLNLSGLLEIYNLRKVKDATIAKEANLFSKKNLERLTLCWGKQQLVISKENNDLVVLEALQPHSGLKVLKIQQYGGHEVANWLAYPVGLSNLVELHLIGFSQCRTIPALWKLRSLQVLCLKYMINLTCFSSFTSFPDIDEEDGPGLFPSLKRLVLVGLKRLETWREGEAMKRTILSFPVLDEMEITNCPNLKTIHSFPVLKYLTISIENHGLLRSVIDLITQSESLVEVKMAKASDSDNEALSTLGTELGSRNCHKIRLMRLDSTNSFFMDRAIPHLRLGFWRSLVSLVNLDIFNCSSIVDWPLKEFRNLGKLKRLSIRMCANLTGVLPEESQEGEELLPLLQSLEFYACPSLKEVHRCSSILYMEPYGCSKMVSPILYLDLDECPEINSISGLNNLKMLFLSCTNWTSLPSGLGDLKKLESLRVSECYALIGLPDELAGLTSLHTLIINKCSRVKSLPVGLEQMLSGLGKFQISECPDLEKLCEEEPYATIISQIGGSGNDSSGPSTDAGSSSEGSP